MTRQQAEVAIMEKLKEIREIALEYSPEDKYLTMFFMDDYLNAENGPDPTRPIRCFEALGDGKGMFSCEFYKEDGDGGEQMEKPAEDVG